MRIAYFINQYPKVSHSFIRREIFELEKQGVKVSRFSVRRSDGDAVDEADAVELEKTHYIAEVSKVEILRLLARLLLSSPVRVVRALVLAIKMGRCSHVGLLKHLFYFVEACLLLDAFQKQGIKHVHAHFGTNPAAVVCLVSVLGSVTYSFTVHGPEEFDKPESLSLQEKIHAAAFVVAISSFGRSQLYRWCEHEHWDKIKIVHCALDMEFLEAEVTPVPDSHVLVCVGRLCEQKGQLLLIEAVHRLNQEGISMELVLAGDGPMRDEIERLAMRYNLTNSVRVTGWISGAQVLEEIVASRGLVLASFAEGLPVVLMEACALYRPVITTYIAGIPELVVDGESGWMIPAGSVDHLYMAMKSLLEMPAHKLEEMGQIGHERVSANHDVRTECSRLKEYFRSTLESV